MAEVKTILEPDLQKLNLMPIGLDLSITPEGDSSHLANQAVYYGKVVYEGMTVEPEYIKKMKIICDSFLPRLELELKMGDNDIFATVGMPKDDTKVGVLLQSSNKKLKSIRMDFKVSTGDMKNNGGEDPDSSSQGIIKIKGVINVSPLFYRRAKAYRDKTSLQVLREAMQELGLGLVSNVKENELDDKMKWLQLDHEHKFLQQVYQHAYIDDENFIHAYVDHHYYLWFVNVEAMLQASSEEFPGYNDLKFAEEIDDEDRPEAILLTNEPSLRNSSSFFSKWEFLNDSTNTSINEGYIRKGVYYDRLGNWNSGRAGKYQSFNLDTNINPEANTNDNIMFKGKSDGSDMYPNVSSYRYLGRTDTRHQHTNYAYAALINQSNMMDLQKMSIRLHMEFANFNLQRLTPVRVVITDRQARFNNPAMGRAELNGDWLVTKLEFIIDNSQTESGAGLNTIKQKVTLAKRELTNAYKNTFDE